MHLKKYTLILIFILFLSCSGCTAIKNSCKTGWTNTKIFFRSGWDKAVEMDAWIKEHMW